MWKKNKATVFFSLGALICGLILGISIHTALNSNSFFTLTLGDLLQSLAELGSASVIAWVIFKAQSKSTRINDLKLKAFEKYLDRIDLARIKADEFITAPNAPLKQEILRELREASNELVLIKDIDTRSAIDGFDYTTVLGHYIAFKAAITGGSFAARTPQFSVQEIKSISDKYFDIRRHLIFLRIDNGT